MNNTSFEREVLERLKAIEVKIDDYKEVKKDAQNALIASNKNKEEINDIQDKIKYITRTISTAIIGGIVGLVFILIRIGMKI